MDRKEELLKIFVYLEGGDYSSHEQCVEHIEEIFAKTQKTPPRIDPGEYCSECWRKF